MRILSLQLQNYRCFESTGEILFSQAINLFVGPNNAGKSTILRAIYGIQQRNALRSEDRRLEQDTAQIKLTVLGDDVERLIPREQRQFKSKAQMEQELVGTRYEGLSISDDKFLDIVINFTNGGEPKISDFFQRLPQSEPEAFILPHLTNRRPNSLGSDVGRQYSERIDENRANLTAKVDRLVAPDHPAHGEYEAQCRAIIGFPIWTHENQQASGKRPGRQYGNHGTIGIESMGAGVLQLAGFIADLVTANEKVFLIEEPENDIHPTALKALCNLIGMSSRRNQFFITTHSNIVVRYLGASRDSRIHRVSADATTEIPTSSIAPVSDSWEERRDLLEELGYELIDIYLPNGWLILEESSAETIIKNFLIPMFTPNLQQRLGTVSAGGADKVQARAEALNQLFLYAHLAPVYQNRAWVYVDGDDKGREVLKKFQESPYREKWGDDHFRMFKKPAFEHYYPATFVEQVPHVLSMQDKKDRRQAKRDLLQEVVTWLKEDRERARQALEESAAEVIEVLQEIERTLINSQDQEG